MKNRPDSIGEAARRRPGRRMRRSRPLREASRNGCEKKVKSEWDEMMEEVDKLVFIGDLTKSQVMMADLDEEPVMEQLRQRYGQEQTWTWNDPTRRVGWGDQEVEAESSTDSEDEAFSHWWK
jgi:hypothetical protein